MDYIFSINKTSLVKSPIFIDGFSRTGKFLLGKLVSCFNGTENFQYISLIEQILFMQKLGSITKDASSTYFLLKLDEYLKRSLEPYGPELKQRILNNKSKSLFVLHESLPHINLL